MSLLFVSWIDLLARIGGSLTTPEGDAYPDHDPLCADN
jgi:hypothetical protein